MCVILRLPPEGHSTIFSTHAQNDVLPQIHTVFLFDRFIGIFLYHIWNCNHNNSAINVEDFK